ncbi:MAG TPA: hemerythrin domain-containing protein [Jatrophihabitantaceae bacterium]|jgi:uncharacterized protein (DUF2249 family)
MSDIAEGGDSAEEIAGSLVDEHTVLRHAVHARAEPVVRAADAGNWPAAELTELVNYLQLEVLRQIADEEWLLFRTARAASDELAALRRDHLELRLSVDRLTEAATARATLAAAQLAAATRDLLDQLDAHLRAEEYELKTAGQQPASTAMLGSQPHEWYAFTEGPRVDLDQLPGPAGADAALARLLRLRPEEQVTVVSGTDPSPLWRRLSYADPGGYGMTMLHKGPPRWEIEIVKRRPADPLVAQPG